VKKVHDKVPVLGSLPLVGRLFRSQGESTQKRNLLIFVTANLVNPGGALKKQPVQSAQTSTLYQNPSIIPPIGPAARER
jgi:general secretion pathway protein D